MSDTYGAGQPVEATTQRDRLRRRRLASAPVAFPRDPAEHAAALRELTVAMTEGRSGDPAAAARIEAARAAVAAVDVEVFDVRAIPSPEWEALKALHPPTPEQSAAGNQHNPDTWRPAVLAACIQPPAGEAAYTEDDWVEFAKDGRVSFGEQEILRATAEALNERATTVDPGKGWTGTRS